MAILKNKCKEVFDNEMLQKLLYCRFWLIGIQTPVGWCHIACMITGIPLFSIKVYCTTKKLITIISFMNY